MEKRNETTNPKYGLSEVWTLWHFDTSFRLYFLRLLYELVRVGREGFEEMTKRKSKRVRSKKRRKQKKVFIWANEKSGLGTKRDVAEIEKVWQSLQKRMVVV